MTELARAGEQPVGRRALVMMNSMRGANATEETETREPSDRQATMDEAVVDDDVRDTEERHADPDPAQDGTVDAVHEAADDDERRSDGCVRHGQDVVRLEATSALFVMASMHGEEDAVPDAAVEEARPELHERRDDQCDDERDDDLDHGWPR